MIFYDVEFSQSTRRVMLKPLFINFYSTFGQRPSSVGNILLKWILMKHLSYVEKSSCAPPANFFWIRPWPWSGVRPTKAKSSWVIARRHDAFKFWSFDLFWTFMMKFLNLHTFDVAPLLSGHVAHSNTNFVYTAEPMRPAGSYILRRPD